MKKLFTTLFRGKTRSDYEDFFNSSMDCFVFTDEDGYITAWNPATEKLFGVPFSAVHGIKIWEIPYNFEIAFNNQTIERNLIKQRFLQFFSSGKSINDTDVTELELQMPDNTKKWIQQTSFKIETPKGFGLGSVIRDITLQKNLELRLRKNETTFHDLERLFNTIENTGEGIGIVDTNEIFLFANDAAEEIFGEKKGGLIGKSVLSYLTEDAREMILAETKKRIKGEKSTYELTIKQPGGAIRSVLLTANPSYNEKGEITGTMGIFRDNTERKIALDLMLVAKEKAEENDRVKSVFLSTMSHELRTPLNAIIGLSEIIRNSSDWDEIHEFTQLINSQGNGLLEIIESIFEIIQLETEDANIETTEIQVDPFFSAMAGKFDARRTFHKKEHVILQYSPDDANQNLIIYSDRKKLKIVIENLVDNALKFTKDGFVEYGFKRADDGVEFFVSDSGVGIEESKKQVIFERFRQADDTHTREFGGIGLGLAICRKIADLMGAEINFSSTPGMGTTFIFHLPCAISSDLLSITNLPSIDQFPDLNHHKILIAEDEQANLRLITTLLERCSAQVITANNGLEAVELVKKNRDISLVITDLNMPVMNGMSTMKNIKTIRPDLPVIALTAYVLSKDKRQFLDEGFNDLVTKPIRNINLLNVVSKFLLPKKNDNNQIH